MDFDSLVFNFNFLPEVRILQRLLPLHDFQNGLISRTFISLFFFLSVFVHRITINDL